MGLGNGLTDNLVIKLTQTDKCIFDPNWWAKNYSWQLAERTGQIQVINVGNGEGIKLNVHEDGVDEPLRKGAWNKQTPVEIMRELLDLDSDYPVDLSEAQ